MERFDERKAIEMEIRDLKEQTRLDFELYFESRKMRNERVTFLLERLRQLDERDYNRHSDLSNGMGITEVESNGIAEIKEGSLTEVISDQDAVDKRKAFSEYKNLVKLESTRKAVKENIEKELVTRKRKGRVYVPFERVEPLVINFLLENQDEVSLADIRKYVEKETGGSWKNFSETLRKIIGKNNKVKHGERRGTYYIEKDEDVNNNEDEPITD